MKKIKLGIDIDEVLCSTNDYFLEEFNKKHNTNFKKEDLTSYKFSNFKEFKSEYIFNELMKHIENNLIKYNILENSKEVLEKLKTKYELYIITSRWIKFKTKTIAWLNKHFKENFFKEILIYNDEFENKCKIDIAKKNKINILIEDAPEFIIKADKENLKIILMDRPWNRKIKENKNIKRVYNWKEIEKELLKEIN